MTAIASPTKSTIMPTMRYRDAPAAIEWLGNVFGFARHAVYANPDGSIAHAELTLNGGMIMLGSGKDDEWSSRFKAPDEMGFETRSVYIVVPDVDSVFERAQAAGAVVIKPPQNTNYGSREFYVKDPEGHTWSAGTYDPWAVHE